MAAGRVGEKQLRAPTLNGAVGAGQWEPHMCVDGVPVTRAKRQLRDRITNWLASHRGYKCTVQDMWAGQEAAKAGQTSLHGGGVGDRWGGRRAAPGTSSTSEVPGAEDAPRQNQGSDQQAPTGRNLQPMRA